MKVNDKRLQEEFMEFLKTEDGQLWAENAKKNGMKADLESYIYTFYPELT